ncbi:MAG: fibronectin type III domain-containing protein [Lachnospiraceae bacterium]|nr:fibronectin type III domain-containing protein [Lachnospiraceae bacterium]
MRKRFLHSAAAAVLSVGLLLGGTVLAFAGQEQDPADESIVAESVSENTTPATTVGVPESIAATLTDEKTIKLTWSAVNGASGYEVYSNTNDNGFTRLWTFEGDVTSMDVLATLDQRALNIASNYSFKVRAFVKDGENVTYGNDSAATAVVKPTRAEADWLLTSEAEDYKSVDLSWKPAGGVSGYKILMSTTPNGQFSVLKTASEPGALIDKDLAGKELSLANTYYFKVQAYIVENGREYVSSESSVVEAKTKLAKTEITYLSANASEFVTLKWQKVKGADGYEVYRSKKKNKNGTVIAGGKKKTKTNKIVKLKKKKLVDKDTMPGQNYWYRVRAYKTINGKRYYSEFDLWPTAAATVLSSTSFVKENCVCEKANTVKLAWKSVKNAKGYFVQRSTNETKGYTTVATIDGGSNISTEIAQDNGTKYYYQIVCFNNKSKKKSWSYPCDPVLITSNYFCYPSETYQERCIRIFGQEYYHAYASQAEADKQMADVAYTKWSVNPDKKSEGYTVKAAGSFKVNKRVQPTIQQIINEVQGTQIQGVNLKIEAASGYNFGSSYQEEREGVTVTLKVAGGTPGTAAYNAVADIMRKYGYNKVSTYNQSYDPDRYIYVGLH